MRARPDNTTKPFPKEDIKFVQVNIYGYVWYMCDYVCMHGCVCGMMYVYVCVYARCMLVLCVRMFVYVCTYICPEDYGLCMCVCMIVYPMYVMHVCNACMYACMHDYACISACVHVCM